MELSRQTRYWKSFGFADPPVMCETAVRNILCFRISFILTDPLAILHNEWRQGGLSIWWLPCQCPVLNMKTTDSASAKWFNRRPGSCLLYRYPRSSFRWNYQCNSGIHLCRPQNRSKRLLAIIWVCACYHCVGKDAGIPPEFKALKLELTRGNEYEQSSNQALEHWILNL